jgi:hypothetical protein
VARFSAANRDGTSVFRRFALPDSAGLRERRGESGRIGAAVWGEPRLREEDPQTSVALPANGAGAAGAPWSDQPGYGGGPTTAAGRIAGPARSDIVGVRAATAESHPGTAEQVAAVAELAADGIAAEKSRSTPKNKTRKLGSGAGSVEGAAKRVRSPATGVSGRERRDHGDDAALWSCSTRPACGRSHPGGTLAKLDRPGGR